MSVKSIYNSLMKHDIILRKKYRDVSGNLSTLSETQLKGFVQFGTDFKINLNSEILEAKAIVFLKSDCGIDENHEYYEIDQTTPNTVNKMTVFNIDRIDNPLNNKTNHYELAVR